MDFSSTNRHFGRILSAECRRLHITRDQIRHTAVIGSKYITAVKQG